MFQNKNQFRISHRVFIFLLKIHNKNQTILFLISFSKKENLKSDRRYQTRHDYTLNNSQSHFIKTSTKNVHSWTEL